MLTRSMVRKLLHGPVTRLREARGSRDRPGDPRGVPARPLMPAAETSTLRLATRGSALALRQAALAAHALQAAGSVDLETFVVRTEGDRRTNAPIDQLEGQGWFTADLELSLLDGRADVAVHSAKDLPSALAPGLSIAAYLVRADARDGVVTASGRRSKSCPPAPRWVPAARAEPGSSQPCIPVAHPADARQRRHPPAQAGCR